MRRVTLAGLVDYVGEVLDAVVENAGRFPAVAEGSLPGLKAVACSDRGALSEAMASGFASSGEAEPVPGGQTTSRIFISHPGLGAVPAPAVLAERFFDSHEFSSRLADAGLRGDYYHGLRYWQFYDLERRVGAQLMLDADAFPPWEPGAPLRSFLHWEYAARGMRLAHAGTLGVNGSGLMFAGSGGAGKSGTVVAGILAGLDSVGDDYVLVDVQNSVRAYPLFTTLKQDQAGWNRLGLDARLARPDAVNWQGKYQFRINDIAARPIPPRLDIAALMLPHVSGYDRTTITPMPRKDAVIALAASGLAQMPGDRTSGFRLFGELTRLLPCYRLSLGVEPKEVAGAISEFIGRNIG